jgi:hypothetical protein
MEQHMQSRSVECNYNYKIYSRSTSRSYIKHPGTRKALASEALIPRLA